MKVFDRTANLAGAQIISYRTSPDGKWATLIGITAGAPERCAARPAGRHEALVLPPARGSSSGARRGAAHYSAAQQRARPRSAAHCSAAQQRARPRSAALALEPAPARARQAAATSWAPHRPRLQR